MKKIILLLIAVIFTLSGFAQQPIRVANTMSQAPDFGRFRIEAGIGYDYRLGKTKSTSGVASDYFDQLRNGFLLDVGVSYFFNPMYSFGLTYNNVWSSASGDNMEDKLSRSFFGPTFGVRGVERNNMAFTGTVGLGRLGFVDRGSAEGITGKITGSSVGMLLDFGVEFRTRDNSFFFVKVNMISGTINDFDVYVEGEKIGTLKDQKESMSSVGLALGMRFGL